MTLVWICLVVISYALVIGWFLMYRKIDRIEQQTNEQFNNIWKNIGELELKLGKHIDAIGGNVYVMRDKWSRDDPHNMHRQFESVWLEINGIKKDISEIREVKEHGDTDGD